MFRTLLLGLLTLAMTGMFIFAGSSKLTPAFNPEMYNELASGFEAFTPHWNANVFNKLGFASIESDYFKRAVGVAEVAFATLLVTPMNRLGAAGLTAIMLGAIMTHVWMDEPIAFPAGLAVANMLIFFLSGGGGNKQKIN